MATLMGEDQTRISGLKDTFKYRWWGKCQEDSGTVLYQKMWAATNFLYTLNRKKQQKRAYDSVKILTSQRFFFIVAM